MGIIHGYYTVSSSHLLNTLVDTREMRARGLSLLRLSQSVGCIFGVWILTYTQRNKKLAFRCAIKVTPSMYLFFVASEINNRVNKYEAKRGRGRVK